MNLSKVIIMTCITEFIVESIQMNPIDPEERIPAPAAQPRRC